MLKTVLAAAAAASFFALGACTQETRIESESDAEQALEEAGQDLENAAEETGDAIEEAGEDAGEAVEDATDGSPQTP
ncbi:MAG: hypothetical protein K2X34_03810 [Hyphomonadaceae bacterium]|nr:hypothetical protein [Hyphomonadaceae bacterium]